MPIWTRRTRCFGGGSSSAWSSSTRCSSRRRCSRPSSFERTRSTPSRVRHVRTARPPARTRSRYLGHLRARRGRRAVGLRQRARARTRSTFHPSASIARRSRTAPSRSSSSTAGIARGRPGARPGGSGASERVHRRRSSGSRDGRAGSGSASAGASPAAGRAGPARLLVRGRRVRALGGEAAADGGRVGAGRGLGRATGEDALPLGPGVDGIRGEPRPSPLLPRSGRLVRRWRERRRLRPAGRRRLGVDVVLLRAVPGLPRVSVPRVLRGLLRRGVPRAARRLVGDQPTRRPHLVPQLGLSGRDGTSSPGSAAPRTASLHGVRPRRPLDTGPRRDPRRRGPPPGRASRSNTPGASFDAEAAPRGLALRPARLRSSSTRSRGSRSITRPVASARSSTRTPPRSPG